MCTNNKWWILLIIVVLIILIIWIAKSNTPVAQPVEGFNSPAISGQYSNPQLDQYYLPNDDIKHLLVDKMVCSPDCCGDQQPSVYDGLSSSQVKDIISSNLQTSMDGSYVRTNYTCGNGQNGVGCPCVTKDSYWNLANRGQNSDSWGDEIDDTLLIDKPYYPSYDNLEFDQSIYTNNPTINDVSLLRSQDLTNVVGYN